MYLFLRNILLAFWYLHVKQKKLKKNNHRYFNIDYYLQMRKSHIKKIHIKNSDTFIQIVNGDKTIEIRKKTIVTDKFNANENISFKHDRNICVVKIIGVKSFTSFAELITSVSKNTNFDKINTKIHDMSSAIVHYSQYYTTTDLNTSFVAIYFTKC